MSGLYELGLYEKALPGRISWRDKLKAARSAGYDFMEISIDETEGRLKRLDMKGSELRDFCDTMFDENIFVRSLCLSGHRKYPLGSNDPEIERRGMEIMRKCIDFASALGVRIIMLAGYDVYYEPSSQETRDRFLANLRKAVDAAAAKGIILAFETMETPFMNTVEKAMAYVSEINSPYLQVYPDIGNITNAADSDGHDLWMDLRSGRGHLVGMHLKETVPGVFRDMMYGDGRVDFHRAISEAWSLGIRRFVTEFWDDGSEGWLSRVSFAHDFIASIIDENAE